MKMWRNLNPPYIVGGNVKWCHYCGTVWQCLKTLNTELPYDLGIPLLGTYTKELKADTQTNTHACMFIAASFTMAKR